MFLVWIEVRFTCRRENFFASHDDARCNATIMIAMNARGARDHQRQSDETRGPFVSAPLRNALHIVIAAWPRTRRCVARATALTRPA